MLDRGGGFRLFFKKALSAPASRRATVDDKLWELLQTHESPALAEWLARALKLKMPQWKRKDTDVAAACRSQGPPTASLANYQKAILLAWADLFVAQRISASTILVMMWVQNICNRLSLLPLNISLYTQAASSHHFHLTRMIIFVFKWVQVERGPVIFIKIPRKYTATIKILKQMIFLCWILAFEMHV